MRRSHPYLLAWLLASTIQSVLIAVVVEYPDPVTRLLARGRIGHLVNRVPHSELIFPVIPVALVLLFIDLLSPALHTPERWPEKDRQLLEHLQRTARALLPWWGLVVYLALWLAFVWVAGVRSMNRRHEAVINLLVLACLVFLVTARGWSSRRAVRNPEMRPVKHAGGPA